MLSTIPKGTDGEELEDLMSIYGRAKPWEILRNFYPVATKNAFKAKMEDPDIANMMIVRHPFTRLVAVYRDKLAK